jgi:phage baseplate assembly protein W
MSIANRTYKDLAFSMFANPMSGDIGKKTGAAAVKGAIVSILKTNFNERLFAPEFGTGIRALLFEQMNPITEQRLKKEVESAVARHEPRAEVLGVTVNGQEEQNRYEINVLFSVASEAEVQKITTYFDVLG